MEKHEIRSFHSTGLELRKEGDSPGRLVGIAVPFGKRSEDLGGWVEQFQQGAFGDGIGRDNDAKALIGHDDRLIALGSYRAGTLILKEEKQGLSYDLDLPDTTAGRDLAVSVERGDVGGVSIGFRVREQGAMWEEEDDDVLVRTVISANLFEMSFVNFPAYVDTSIAQRSFLQWRGTMVRSELAEQTTAQAARLQRAQLQLRGISV